MSRFTHYTDRYQVRTDSGRHIGSFHHIEEAELIFLKGRARVLYIWDNRTGRYYARRWHQG